MLQHTHWTPFFFIMYFICFLNWFILTSKRQTGRQYVFKLQNVFVIFPEISEQELMTMRKDVYRKHNYSILHQTVNYYTTCKISHALSQLGQSTKQDWDRQRLCKALISWPQTAILTILWAASAASLGCLIHLILAIRLIFIYQ